MDEAFEGAHVVIPKNWGGFGAYGVQEYLDNEDECKKEMKANLEKYHDWICDSRRIKLADKNVNLMHALPADRNHEVTDEVIDDPNISVVYDEAENRLHTAKAIMSLTMQCLLIATDFLVEKLISLTQFVKNTTPKQKNVQISVILFCNYLIIYCNIFENRL